MSIVIDEKLMAEAMALSGLKTKKATVEEGLKLLIQIKMQEKIKNFHGKLQWEGDLGKSRTDD